MSVDKAHLIAVALGNAGYEVLDVTKGSANSGHGLARSKPSINLQLATTIHKLKVKVEMLEIPGELPARALNLDLLGVDLHLHALRDVHGLRRQDGLHLLGDAIAGSMEVSAAGCNGAWWKGKGSPRTRFYIPEGEIRVLCESTISAVHHEIV